MEWFKMLFADISGLALGDNRKEVATGIRPQSLGE